MSSSEPVRTYSDEELRRDGWERRFVAAPARVQEVVSTYESLGYEVHLEPLTADELEDECQGCSLATVFFRVVYTRKRVAE